MSTLWLREDGKWVRGVEPSRAPSYFYRLERVRGNDGRLRGVPFRYANLDERALRELRAELDATRSNGRRRRILKILRKAAA